MKILITGSAGLLVTTYIVLHQKFKVLGCDNLTSVSKKLKNET